jgi:hypothetical protein
MASIYGITRYEPWELIQMQTTEGQGHLVQQIPNTSTTNLPQMRKYCEKVICPELAGQINTQHILNPEGAKDSHGSHQCLRRPSKTAPHKIPSPEVSQVVGARLSLVKNQGIRLGVCTFLPLFRSEFSTPTESDYS